MSHLFSKTLRHATSSAIRSWSATSHCHGLRRYTRRHIQTASASASSSSPSSSASNPYPYPTNRHPTPYQLFHLPSNATKGEIKARYYELVRLYHPDKQVGAVVDDDIARARFQAITAAYDVLTGKTPAGSGMPGDMGHNHTPREAMSHATTAAYRAARQRRQELYDSGSVDDVKKDRFIMAGVVLVRALLPSHPLSLVLGIGAISNSLNELMLADSTVRNVPHSDDATRSAVGYGLETPAVFEPSTTAGG
ncbi:hypothetical protein D9619_001340 [Psilocybe cf. subviscida]|uniref:J domain-containing protein n=1 Tax=Psilocybe cf. subviscida TaxID=2480587 RepID=A0A8H5BFX8_9AGAR|nr:hypothetical protein D9619_001340 [Psilocybe cf. subviscida]